MFYVHVSFCLRVVFLYAIVAFGLRILFVKHVSNVLFMRFTSMFSSEPIISDHLAFARFVIPCPHLQGKLSDKSLDHPISKATRATGRSTPLEGITSSRSPTLEAERLVPLESKVLELNLEPWPK